MNGLEKIINKISADAKAQADEIKQRAEAAASDIAASFKAEAEKIINDAKSKAERDCAGEIHRIRSKAAIEAGIINLESRRRILNSVFDKAFSRILSLDKKEYAQFLARLIVKSGKKGAVVLSSRDAAALDEIKAQISAIAPDSEYEFRTDGEFGRGFVLISETVQVSCVLERIFEALRAEWESEIAAMLFDCSGGAVCQS